MTEKEVMQDKLALDSHCVLGTTLDMPEYIVASERRMRSDFSRFNGSNFSYETTPLNFTDGTVNSDTYLFPNQVISNQFLQNLSIGGVGTALRRYARLNGRSLHKAADLTIDMSHGVNYLPKGMHNAEVEAGRLVNIKGEELQNYNDSILQAQESGDAALVDVLKGLLSQKLQEIKAQINQPQVRHIHIEIGDQGKNFPALQGLLTDGGVLDLIQARRADDESVLINCQEGMSRSAIVCIYLLMRDYNIHPLEAIAYLRAHRPFVAPQVGMIKAIMEAHNALNAEREAAGEPRVNLNTERLVEFAKHAAGTIHHQINQKAARDTVSKAAAYQAMFPFTEVADDVDAITNRVLRIPVHDSVFSEMLTILEVNNILYEIMECDKQKGAFISMSEAAYTQLFEAITISPVVAPTSEATLPQTVHLCGHVLQRFQKTHTQAIGLKAAADHARLTEAAVDDDAGLAATAVEEARRAEQAVAEEQRAHEVAEGKKVPNAADVRMVDQAPQQDQEASDENSAALWMTLGNGLLTATGGTALVVGLLAVANVIAITFLPPVALAIAGAALLGAGLFGFFNQNKPTKIVEEDQFDTVPTAVELQEMAKPDEKVGPASPM